VPSKHKNIILVFILVLAAGLRLAAVFHYGDFLWDEMFSFTFSQKPWLESVKLWLWETNPPLHMAILKLWFYVFPANEFFTRLPSVLFGVLGVWAIYKTVKIIFNDNRLALLSAVVLTFSPYHIFMSATGRGYTLLMLLDILAVYFFYQIFFKNKTDKKTIILLGLINLLLMFTHLTAAFIIAGQLIALAVKKSGLKLWLSVNAVPLLCFGVWTALSLPLKINLDLFGGGWYFLTAKGVYAAVNSFQPLILGPHLGLSEYSIYFFTAFFLLGVFTVLYRQSQIKNLDKKFIVLLFMTAMPVVVSGALEIWNIKFFMIALPWAAVAIAYLLNSLIKNRWLVAVVLVILVLPGCLYIYYLLPLNDWRVLNGYLATNYRPKKKQIYIYNLFIDKLLIDRYYQSPIPTLPYFTGADWERDVISKNFLRFKHPSEELNQWLDNQHIENYDEIFLSEEKCGIDLSAELNARGWLMKKSFYAHQLDRKKLYLYVRPETN